MKFDDVHITALKIGQAQRSEDQQVGKLIRITDRALYFALLYDDNRSRILDEVVSRMTAAGYNFGENNVRA